MILDGLFGFFGTIPLGWFKPDDLGMQDEDYGTK